MDPGTAQQESQTRLREYLTMENESLMRTLRVYVARAGLGETQVAISGVAAEVLNDVVVEALAHADRFDGARAPGAWLLGIGANLIRRRQVERAKRERREPLVRDMGNPSEVVSDDDLFDRLAALTEDDPARALESKETLAGLLGHVSEADQLVIRLGVLHGLDGEALAGALGISPGAARVRLHRALRRLRDAVASEGVTHD